MNLRSMIPMALAAIASVTTLSTTADAAPTCSGSSLTSVNMSVRNTWQWYENDSGNAMKCLDGTYTGFGYYIPSSWNGNVAFFFDGGGMCYDAASCSHVGVPSASTVFAEVLTDTKPTSSTAPFLARNHYDCSTNFATDLLPPTGPDANGVTWSLPNMERGVLDHTSSINPLENYMTVFVPYCTGDMHVGNRLDTSSGVAGRTPSNLTFYGLGDTYATLLTALAAAEATAPNSGHEPQKVVLIGGSAGGWGVLYSYGMLRNHILGPPSNGARVWVIDDGGTPLTAGTSTDHAHWNQVGYLQTMGPTSGQGITPVSSFEEWQYDAWGGSGWASWFDSSALTSVKPLGDGYAFVSSQAAALYSLQTVETPGSWGFGDLFAFIDGTSDWLYWYDTPTLWMNDDAYGKTPTIGTAQSQMVSAGVGSAFHPITSVAIEGIAQWYKHHTFIGDDVSTWSPLGSNVGSVLNFLGL